MACVRHVRHACARLVWPPARPILPHRASGKGVVARRVCTGHAIWGRRMRRGGGLLARRHSTEDKAAPSVNDGLGSIGNEWCRQHERAFVIHLERLERSQQRAGTRLCAMLRHTRDMQQLPATAHAPQVCFACVSMHA